MNYNYLFDLTPISYQEQLICSDYLEDKEEENLAHCLRFNYKICNYTNKSENYGKGYEYKNCGGNGCGNVRNSGGGYGNFYNLGNGTGYGGGKRFVFYYGTDRIIGYENQIIQNQSLHYYHNLTRIYHL